MCHMVPQPMYCTWQCVMRYHNQCISPGNVTCGTTTSDTWPSWERIQNLHKFRNYKSIRQHLCFCVGRKCKITYFYVTNNLLRLNVTLFFFVSAFHLAMCHTVPRPVPFTWHYVIW
jgi:hypothetical protein